MRKYQQAGLVVEVFYLEVHLSRGVFDGFETIHWQNVVKTKWPTRPSIVESEISKDVDEDDFIDGICGIEVLRNSLAWDLGFSQPYKKGSPKIYE